MADTDKILKSCALFQGLQPEQMDSLLPYGSLRTFPQKGEIISIQEQVDWFGVILSGRARTMQMFVNGDFSLMETLHPGYMLGIDLICTKTRKSPYCAAADVPTQILRFPSWVILQPGVFPEPERMAVWQNLLTMLSQANMRKYNRLAVLSQRGMRDRILTFLSMQSAHRGSTSFRIPFSREELAEFLCVNRSSLSHELSLMAQDGLIQFHKNQFTLLPEGLRQSKWIIL